MEGELRCYSEVDDTDQRNLFSSMQSPPLGKTAKSPAVVVRLQEEDEPLGYSLNTGALANDGVSWLQFQGS